MRVEKFGIYNDEVTGNRYTVLKRIKEINHKALSSRSKVKLDSTFDFITECGIDLNPLDDDFNSFELVQIDGVIKRVRN